MREQFLHFVWQYQRFNKKNLKTTCGKNLHIIEVGQSNEHDGPDFLFAKIQIDDVIWVGHVEIHVASDDWDKHRHTSDNKYNNVVLHVVYRHEDCTVNDKISTLELNGLIPKSIYDRYESIMNSNTLLPCRHLIPELDPAITQIFMQRLAIERLEQKAQKIEHLLQVHHNDFEQVSFIWLSRYFGLGANSDAFQELSSKIKIQWLYKIRSEWEGTTALLMGSAGFLKSTELEDKYIRDLKNQFLHFENKWNLRPLEDPWWNWKTGRPAGFPSIRMAQLAKLIEHTDSLFSLLIEVENFETALQNIHLHPFWENHYHFNQISVPKEKRITNEFYLKLLVNVSAPLMIVYSQHMNDDSWIERALQILESSPPENNRITKYLNQEGLPNSTALESQALIHLKNEYCDQKKCLNCQIGNKIIQPKLHKLEEPYVNLNPREVYI